MEAHGERARGDGLVVALGVALVLGMLDLGVGVLAAAGHAEPGALAAHLAAASGGFLVAYALASALVLAPLRAAFGLERGALRACLAVFLFLVWAALAVELSGADWLFPARLALPFAGALGAAALAYPLLRARAPGPGFWVGASWLATAGVGIAWFVATRAEPSAGLTLAAGFAALLTIGATVRVAPRVRPLLTLGTLAAAVAVAGVLGSLPEQRTERALAQVDHPVERVIFIVVDTLRRDRLSCYADDAPPTPNIDALAGDSLVFDTARGAASWTLPAMCSMLSGVAPEVHGTVRPGIAFPTELPTMPEALADAGYRTAAIGKNTILKPSSRLDRGFDHYDFYPHARPSSPIGRAILKQVAPDLTRRDLLAEDLNQLAFAWLDRHRDEDFFLWLHYFDPHLPYVPPARFLPEKTAPGRVDDRFHDLDGVRRGHFVPTADEWQRISDLYDAEVRYLDEQLGVLVEHLKREELYDDTLIVLTSDHGEEFYEHGGFAHGHSVYDEVLRVPLMLKLPGAERTGRVSAAVSTESLAPTLLELCGVPYDADALTSTSLLRRTDQLEVTTEPRPFLCTSEHYYARRGAVIFGDAKYLFLPDSGHEELYDLAHDPDELHSLLPGARAPVDEALRHLAELRAKSELVRAQRDVGEALDAELGAQGMAELRAMGYVE
jgi:arylsulfatase A-like enzyme